MAESGTGGAKGEGETARLERAGGWPADSRMGEVSGIAGMGAVAAWGTAGAGRLSTRFSTRAGAGEAATDAFGNGVVA